MPNFLIETLAETLREIWIESSTCLVRISTDSGLRMAFFEEGALVYFASEDEREPLRDFLTAHGRVDDDAAVARIATLGSKTKPLVAQIIESGIADAGRLQPLLMEFARECMSRAFDDRFGTVKVMKGVRATHPAPFSVPSRLVALESIRGMTDVELIREAVGPLTWTVTPADDHFDRLMSLPLNYTEGVIGSQLTAAMSIKDLLAVSDATELDALRAVLALRVAGVTPPSEEPRGLTDTGRLRMRKKALETGITIDPEAAAIAIGMTMGQSDEVVSGEPITMSEFETTEEWNPAVFSSPPPTQSVYEPPKSRPRRKGESGQLRLLASAYIDMAQAEAAAGNFNGAVRYYETALGQKPGELTVILPFVAYLLTFDMSHTRELAERLLRQGCVMNPTSVEPRLELAALFRKTGRSAQALEVLSEAERVNPDDARVREMIEGKHRGFFGRLRGQ